MSLLIEAKRASYTAQRTASQGAGITLVQGINAYSATFDCAERIASVLGTRELRDLGDGIFEVIPFYRILSEDMYSAIQKLTARFSVALVEYVMTKSGGGQFVLIARINPSKVESVTTTDIIAVSKPQPSTNIDDY